MNRLLALALAASFSACGSGKERPPAPSSSVIFEIEPVQARDASRLAWIATHKLEGKVARFRIELEPEPRGATAPAFVSCSLSREPDSVGSALLSSLAKALGGAVPPSGPGLIGVNAPAVFLGRNLSRGGKGNLVAGLFGTEPAGSWISTKLTFEDGEVFLNLDPAAGYGEFSLKDVAYARGVLSVLGRVLQSPPGEFVDLASNGRADGAQNALTLTGVGKSEPITDWKTARIANLSREASSSEESARINAIEGLAELGPAAREATPLFVNALRDPADSVRLAAIRGFARILPDPATGLAAVRPLLNDNDVVIQALAAGALADFGEPDLAVEELRKHLLGPERTWAAVALGRLGSHAGPAVPALAAMIESRKTPAEGMAACRALGAIGKAAASAFPALRNAAADQDRSLRDTAMASMQRIQGALSLPVR
ncbi:MAG: HEAT repeat domain-containing protein [Vicinamibacteria bacterium]